MNQLPQCAATCSTWAAMTARDWHQDSKLIVCDACLTPSDRKPRLYSSRYLLYLLTHPDPPQ